MPRLIPPQDGATVRMYRIGHGDCFLLAFPGKVKTKPVYVLIDCGFKPGSPEFVGTAIDDIVEDIKDATGGHIDVAVITHEHQDHVNGISEKRFADIKIGQAWFAWTEDPDDEDAKLLRQKHKDRLVALAAARNRLGADGEDGEARDAIDDFMSLELGGEDDDFDAAAAFSAAGLDGGGAKNKVSANKRSMKVFKDHQQDGIKFINPHEEIIALPGASGVRVFALGPPRDEKALRDLDPEGEEEFSANHRAFARPEKFLAAALASEPNAKSMQPFSSRYFVALDNPTSHPATGDFLAAHYGTDGAPQSAPTHGGEVADNAAFRRIDHDWVYAAEQLALAMNRDTNNSSLVLAFELESSGKVLLFAADAQRGNWLSWKGSWEDNGKEITARDLLARTVLYKVGHHCSHNATLNGTAADDYPNIGWMAHGEFAKEFTAMITAVAEWAKIPKGRHKKPWDHPRQAIKTALLKKASGRVFQTDTEFKDMKKAGGFSETNWLAFEKRAKGTKLYFDYTIKA